MTSATGILLKLALRACERGDAAGAAEALRAVLAVSADTEYRYSVAGPTAESFAAFAKRIGRTSRHVRDLADRGAISCVGAGRGRSVLIDESISMLRASSRKTSSDDTAEAGAAWARRRGALRVVGEAE